jgi:hypothetical protein
MIARHHALGRLAALAAVLAAVSSPARAAEGTAPAVIFLYAQDQAEQARAVSGVVASQLGELAVTFREVSVERLASSSREQLDAAASVAASAETIAVFWCDLSTDRDALLHLTDGRGSRLLVRRLEIADVRSRAESIAIVVQSSVRALLGGGTIGIAVPERPKPEPPPAKPPPPPVRNAPERLALKLAYNVASRSAETIFNHGLYLGVECRFARFLSAVAAYTLSTPIEGNGELADVRITSHRLSFGLGADYRVGRLSVGAAAAFELDFAEADVSDVAAGLDAAADTTDVVVAFAPSARVAFAATERFSVFAEIGVELLANAKRYTARRGGTRDVLVDTWPTQPFVRLGFVVWLF